MRQEGLSKLSEDLDKGFEDFVKELAVNRQAMLDAISDVNTHIDDLNPETNNTLAEYLGTYSEALTPEMITGLTKIATTTDKMQTGELTTTAESEQARADVANSYQWMLEEARAEVAKKQPEREARRKQLEELYRTTETPNENKAPSMLDDIKRSQDSIDDKEDAVNKNLNRIINAIISGENNTVVDMISNVDAQLEAYIRDYFSDDNNIIDQATDAMTKILGYIQINTEESAKATIEVGKNTGSSAVALGSITAAVQAFIGENGQFTTLGKAVIAQMEGTKSAIASALADTQKSLNQAMNPQDEMQTQNGFIDATNGFSADIEIDEEMPDPNVNPAIYLKSETYRNGAGDPIGTDASGNKIYASDQFSYDDNSREFGMISADDSRGLTSTDSTFRFDGGATIYAGSTDFTSDDTIIAVDDADYASGLAFDDLGFIGGYASGTKNAKPGIHRINENGQEVIVSKHGTFFPFAGGEGVIPAKQTSSLLKLANSMANGGLPLQMPDMSNYNVGGFGGGNVTNNATNITFGSLITINGNATQDTVNEIKQIAQNLVNNRQFQENVTEFVSKRQASDGRMAGKRNVVR